ncbi:MAG: hypothetical protein JNG83_01765 [Opitutaceae bacterium]|nr:hypothetical protein [Opitutaceae bacterium]
MTLLPRKNCAALAALLAVLAVSATAAEKLLLLDDRVVERADRVRLRVGEVTKHPANPLFGEDRPWEVRYDNVYVNVAYDEATGEYHAWYSPFIVDELTTGTPPERRAAVRYHSTPTREMGLCYATSTDGIRWRKPELGLIEFNGSTANNLVRRSVHGAGVLHDPLEKDPARRYKVFGGEQIPGRPRRFEVAFSPDGRRWAPPIVCPEIGVTGDTHNNALWVPELGRYVGLTRRWLGGQRLVMRAESADFTRWSPAVEVMRGDDVNQTYALVMFPYGGVYLGLLMIMNQQTDRVHCELAWSPDTLLWHRIDAGRALIPNAETPGAYDWGCVYAGTGPVVRGDTVQLFYGASNGPHTGWRDGFLALATLPRDRFAGYVAGAEEGTLVTRPIRLGGGPLTLNVAAPAGAVTVEVLDADERPLPGYQARLEAVDGLRVEPRWAGGADLAALRDRTVRLRFRLRQATLFACDLP